VAKPVGTVHQADYYQALVAALGIVNGPQYAHITPPALAESVALTPPYVVLAPGAAYGSAKQWPPERFAELAQLLARDGQRVVLVGASGDTATCRAVVQAMGSGTTAAALSDLSGRTTLGQLAAVLAGAAAVVANDSGAMHLAGASGAPVVALFGATNEQRTSPLVDGPDAIAPAIVATDVWCRPCMLRECPIDHRCMTRISAAAVMAATAAVRR
jgi:heptosyltransferase-2